MAEQEAVHTNLLNLMQKLSEKIEASDQRAARAAEVSDQRAADLQGSIQSLFNTEANVQRAAITEQANRVTKLESMLTAMMGEMKSIKGDIGDDEPSILKMLEYENVPDVEPEDMMEQAIQASARRSTFFELPENKGKHDKYQKDLRHIHAMEPWKGKEDFRDWLTAAVAWVGHVDLSVMDHTEVKFALWRGVPDEKRRLADVLKPGSKAWMHDNLKEYTRRLLDTFQPPRYTEVWKQKYTARVHKVGEPVECYLADKMRLFKSSHNPYDFKRFLETGLQSICHPKLQQHVVSQKYRTFEGMMKDISEISSKWRALHHAGHDPTSTLAGIMEPPLMRDCYESYLAHTGQHKMEVDAVQSVTEPWMCLPGEVNALGNCYNCQQPGHIKSQCTKARVTAPVSTTPANPGTRFAADVGKCYKCDKPGHFARECRAPGGGNQLMIKHNPIWASKFCQYCKKQGHLIGDCRLSKKRAAEGKIQEVNDEGFPLED